LPVPSPSFPACTRSTGRSRAPCDRTTTARTSNGSLSSSRASGKLLELLPTVPVGTSRMIEREVLSSFLNRVHEAEDVTTLFEQLSREKVVGSRPKLHSLVRRDLDFIGLTSLPGPSSAVADSRLASAPSKSSHKPCSPSPESSKAKEMSS